MSNPLSLLGIERNGGYRLPYDSVRIALPPGDARRLLVEPAGELRWTRVD